MRVNLVCAPAAVDIAEIAFSHSAQVTVMPVWASSDADHPLRDMHFMRALSCFHSAAAAATGRCECVPLIVRPTF